MTRFFKNIRQQLATQNKIAAYLRYAVGEILLVVIGILIAVQVNNWNENRKAKIQEISQLKGIQEDIMLDRNDVDWNTKYNTMSVKSIQELLDFMMRPQNKPKENIDFGNALGTPIVLTLHESSFNNLKNNNFNNISNKKLKKQIANYYDNFSKIILTTENDQKETQAYSVLRPYFLKYFHYVQKSENVEYYTNEEDFYIPKLQFNKLVLSDTLGLRNDESFKIVLAETIRLVNIKIEYYNNFLKRIDELNAAINEELKRLE